MKILIRATLVVLASLASGAVAANATSEWFVPTGVRVASATNFHFRVEGMPAVAGCSSSPTWAYVNEADSGAVQKIATLREAFLQQKPVQLDVEFITTGTAIRCRVKEVKLALNVLPSLPPNTAVKISQNNEVDWIGASAEGFGTSSFVQWKNATNIDAACIVSNGYARSRIALDDRALFSLLLAAKSANRKVGFYYVVSERTGGAHGHGISCQLVNAWLE